jgi:hypothetical protein
MRVSELGSECAFLHSAFASQTGENDPSRFLLSKYVDNEEDALNSAFQVLKEGKKSSDMVPAGRPAAQVGMVRGARITTRAGDKPAEEGANHE